MKVIVKLEILISIVILSVFCLPSYSSQNTKTFSNYSNSYVIQTESKSGNLVNEKLINKENNLESKSKFDFLKADGFKLYMLEFTSSIIFYILIGTAIFLILSGIGLLFFGFGSNNGRPGPGGEILGLALAPFGVILGSSLGTYLIGLLNNNDNFIGSLIGSTLGFLITLILLASLNSIMLDMNSFFRITILILLLTFPSIFSVIGLNFFKFNKE